MAHASGRLNKNNAVVVSKFIYGLETLEPTEGVANMLNTTQLKGLRKILNMKTTFVDRTNTNEVVHKKAQDVLRTKNQAKPREKQKPEEWLTRQVRPVTQVLEEKKLHLLGHIIRRPFTHPLQAVTFDSGSTSPYGRPLIIKTCQGKRRQGRPRLHWTEENMAKAWKYINEDPNAGVPENLAAMEYDNGKQEMNVIIAKRAQQYLPPLQGARKKKQDILQRG